MLKPLLNVPPCAVCNDVFVAPDIALRGRRRPCDWCGESIHALTCVRARLRTPGNIYIRVCKDCWDGDD